MSDSNPTVEPEPAREEAFFQAVAQLAYIGARPFLDAVCVGDRALRSAPCGPRREEPFPRVGALANALNPAEPTVATRRLSLLNRAAGIITSLESQGRMSVWDKEILAKIQSLRTAAHPNEKTEAQKP